MKKGYKQIIALDSQQNQRQDGIHKVHIYKFWRKKKIIIHFFWGTKHRMRNMLKALHVYINGGFKLFIVLLFIIADNLEKKLLLWTNYYGGSYEGL